MSDYPLVNKADQYARDITAGRIVANKWVKLACKHHLGDIKAQKSADFPYYFDSEAAEKALNFVQLMPHTKGKWARERRRLELEPWQCFFVASIFGWKRRKDGLRKYRQCALFVPRKNGKSALAAAIANYMFAADGEYGAEIYAGATTERQAWEVFRPAKIMVQNTPEFKDAFNVQVNASNMNISDDGSRFEPIIGNPPDGSSPHLAVADEYHEHPDDRLVETMLTGMGAREQPMLLIITTAGSNLEGPCFDFQLDAQKILEGTIEDDGVFSLLYGIDEGDDWTDPAILRKANPNMGVSVNEDFLLAQLQQAKNNARKQSAFKTKHLNVWVGSKDAYYNVEKWRALGDPSLKLEQFKGLPVYIGLDLASRVDIAAVEILIPYEGGYVQFGKHYLPEATVEEKEHYIKWATEGLITVTDGEIIDFNAIKEDILELCRDFEVLELAYDPFQATMLITDLIDEGVNCVEMRPTVLNFSEPMKELDSLIRAGRIRHDGNICFSWMISNVTGKLDKKDNVYPNKDRPENKIDGPVALMMALGRAMNAEINGIDSAIDNPLSMSF